MRDGHDPLETVAGARAARRPSRRRSRRPSRRGGASMSMDDDALDRRLAALKRELATHNPPPAVDRTIAAAIAGRERAASPGARRFSWIGRERTLAWPLAL